MESLNLLRNGFIKNSKAIALEQGKTEKEVRNSFVIELEKTHSPINTNPTKWYRLLYNISLKAKH